MINKANGSTTQITKLIQNKDTVYHLSPLIRNILMMGREYTDIPPSKGQCCFFKL